MKKSRYTEAQIVSILKEAENGVPVSDLCRTHGMSSAAFYQWRSKYGGMVSVVRVFGTMDLSRFDAAPLIAFTATKEMNYGTETD